MTEFSLAQSLNAGLDTRMRSVADTTQSQRQRDFASLLNREMSMPGAGKDTPEQSARAAAEDFVATALVQPLLKAVREANQAPAPWGPTDVEKQFGGFIDADRSRQIVRAGNFGIVDRLARDLLTSATRTEVTDDHNA
ncbi:MAG: hypothetical protein AAGI53_01085 [Planctomycetota bacterium]